MDRKNLLWTGIILISIAVSLGSIRDANGAAEVVPVTHTFAGKIVYTTDAAFDQRILEADCERRGGRFNVCGSVCDDALEDVVCVTVCAYTCEFDVPQKNAAEDYNELREACKGNICCLQSVDSMKERLAFRRRSNESCPEGYDSNMLRCRQSYQWCQPTEEYKKK